jgi:hypothetical protein
MTTKKNRIAYTAPNVECVRLDNEISLILQSLPNNDPFGGDDWWSKNESNGPDVFKTDIG